MLSFLRCMSGDVIAFGAPFSEGATEDRPIKLLGRPMRCSNPILGGLGLEDDVDDAHAADLATGRVSSHSQRASDQRSRAVLPRCPELTDDLGSAAEPGEVSSG
jgi:hypothetical protein